MAAKVFCRSVLLCKDTGVKVVFLETDSVDDSYCKPIHMDEFIDQYISGGEREARAAAKRLTARIERRLVENTVNAPDWCVKPSCSIDEHKSEIF